MSMFNKKSLFKSEDISKFSPLMQFFYYDLSIEKINQEILNFGDDRQNKLKDEYFKSRFDEVADIVVKSLDDAVKEINNVLQSDKNSRRDSDFTRINQAQVNYRK